MNPVLQKNLFFVKEHIGYFKAAKNYDIFDPETGEMILICREPTLGFFTKVARFTEFRTASPFDVHVTTPDGDPVVRIKRGINLYRSRVNVLDETDEQIGTFQQKLMSIGGAFQVLGADGAPLCNLQGSWTGFQYQFVHSGQVLAEVDKKWTGLGKEMFTSADNYVLRISEIVPPDNPIRLLIMGAVFCIDMVLKAR